MTDKSSGGEPVPFGDQQALFYAELLQAPTFELNICAGVMLRHEAIKLVKMAGQCIRGSVDLLQLERQRNEELRAQLEAAEKERDEARQRYEAVQPVYIEGRASVYRRIQLADEDGTKLFDGSLRELKRALAAESALRDARNAALEEAEKGQLKEKIMDGITKQVLLGAIARGWCHSSNANKEMDSDLASAIAEELQPIVEEIEERERLRLAGISTAAIGYWKEGDQIHPDYDTVALRDVAKLYQKYVAASKSPDPKERA